MFRTSREETENRLLHELGDHDFDVPALRQALARVLPGKNGFTNFELRSTSQRLGPRTLLLTARPLFDGGARTDLILLAIEDVTDRKQYEEALHESESKIRAIVAAAADGIVTIDEGGCILSFNRAAQRIFGYSATEAIGQNVSILMPDPARNEHMGYLQRYLQTGVPRIIGTTRELVGRRKDGVTFPMELSVGEYHDGTTRGFVGIVRDIAGRKRAEEEADRHRLELARALRVGAMGELAAGLAHELNQPLSVVANTLEACTTRLRAGQARPGTLIRLIERATAEVVRTGEIVRHVRGLVQNREPRRERHDLRRLIEGVTPLLAGELKSHRVTLRLELGDRPLPVRVVRIQLEQVLLNLLQNAIDAIRLARGPRREIVVRAMKSAAGLVGVAVHDTGTGIAEGVAQRMFEPLFTTKRAGLGMGLAISRSIVEAHRGRLWVAPEERGPGEATLRFTLPLESERRARPADARTGRTRAT